MTDLFLATFIRWLRKVCYKDKLIIVRRKWNTGATEMKTVKPPEETKEWRERKKKQKHGNEKVEERERESSVGFTDTREKVRLRVELLLT